jgi:hypothetical protein
VRRTGSGPTLTECTYREQFGSRVEIVSMKQGRYTVDVFEARTHRTVGSARVDGVRRPSRGTDELRRFIGPERAGPG